MGRSNWYKKWQMDKSFIIENDVLKEKIYIFAPFVRTNQFGFQNADIRNIIAGDCLARYQRLQDKNVLFPTGYHSLCNSSFIESKKSSVVLDEKIQAVFFKQMLELGIGINEAKHIDMRGDECLRNMQQAFIDLYNKKYISYKDVFVYFDKPNNKIYDSLNNVDDELPLIKQKCFVLNIENLIPQIIKDINELKCDDKIKRELINGLLPIDIMNIDFMVSNGLALNVELDNPECIGGISYIFLNPNFMDVENYIIEDEFESVMSNLEEEHIFAYTGFTAKNPLTGIDIPIFVSNNYNEAIHLGIPSISDTDLAICNSYGLDVIEILNNDTLINSDLLDGYAPKEARRKIFDVFLDAEIAASRMVYKKKEIVLSSLDSFGPLFPFLLEGDKLNSLSLYLPYTFSSQFRPLLNSNVDVAGEGLSGTINNLFIEGIMPILSILYDEISSSESIFSYESKKEYEAWGSIDTVIIESENINSQLLMPIIIHNIIKKELGYNLPNLFKRVLSISKVVDENNIEYKRSNNNLMDFEYYLNHFYSDSIRFYMLYFNFNKELPFDKNKLKEIDDLIKSLEDRLLNLEPYDNNKYDYYFYALAKKAKEYLDDNQINNYIKLIYKFITEFVFNQDMTKKQLLMLIKVLFPVFPYLSDQVFESVFNSKYSIINEGWPV